MALAEAVVELGLDTTELDDDLRDVEGSFDDLAEATDLELTLDADDALRDVGELGDELQSLEDEAILVEVDTDDALREVDRLGDELESLEDEAVAIEVDTDDALRDVSELGDDLEALEAEPLLIEADTDDALENVGELSDELEELEELEPLQLELDTEGAVDDVAEVQASIDAIAAEPVEVEVEVDADKAGAAISAGIAGGAARSGLAASSAANFLGEIIGNVGGQIVSDSYGGALTRGILKNAPAIATAGRTAGATFVGGLSATTLAAGAGVAAVGLAAGLVFVQGFSRGIAELETQEQIERNLIAILGDADVAGAVQQELTAVANTTAFATSEILNLGASLAAVAPQLGIEVQDIDQAVLRLADTAAFAGLGIADLNEIVRALSQGASAGKLNMEDFRQVLDRIPALGPQIKSALADDIGVPLEDLNNAIARGEVTSEALVGVLLEVETTMGQAAAQAATFSGIMSTLSSTIDQGFANVLRDSGLDDALSELFDPDLIASIADGFSAAFSVVASLVSSLVPVLGPVIEIVSELAQTIASILAPALSVVGSIVSVVVVPVLRLLQFALQPVLDFVQLIGVGFEYLADQLRGFVNTVSGFLAPLARSFPGFEELFGIGDTGGATDAFDSLSTGVDGVTESVTELADASPVELEIDAETQDALDQIERLDRSILELLTGDGRSVDLDLDVRLADVDLFDGLIRSIETGGDEAAAEVALGVARIAEEYEAALTGIDEADSLADRLEAQLDASEIERRLAQLIPQLQGAGLTEENVRQLINEFGGSPEQIDSATDLIVQAYAGARDRIAAERRVGQDFLAADRVAGLAGTQGDAGILDPVINDLEAGEAELIAVQQRIATQFGVLPATGYGFPDDAVAGLQERVDLVVGGFGDVEETAVEIVDTLGDLDLAEPLTLDRSEARELVRAFDDAGEDGARAYIDSIETTIRRRDRASTFRLDGLEDAIDLSLGRVSTLERAASAVGLSGARISQGGISFSTTINVTGTQSVRTLDALVRASGDSSPTTRQSSRTAGGNSFE